LRILIVGAGIAGLAAARALEMQGFHPELVERQDAPPTAGKSLFLLGNATRALSQLGLQEQVLRMSHPIKAQTILSSQGRILNHIKTDTIWADCGPCIAILRQALVEILQASLVTTKIKFGLTVMHTAARAGGRVVHFSDGRAEEYDLVIGADGVRSAVRAAAFGNTAPDSVGFGAWRFVIDNRYHVDHWIAMLGAGRSILATPLPLSQLYLYADCSSIEFGDGSIAVMKRLFKDFAYPFNEILDDLDAQADAHRALLVEVPNRPYIADCLALIGDAAHASSPSMAQGAAMAIEDGIVLARCLFEHPVTERALSQFGELRRRRVEWVQKQGRTRDKLRTAPDFARNLLLRGFGTQLYRRAYGQLRAPL